MNKAELARAISQYFSFDEIEGLYFELGFDFDDVPGQTKSAKARQLILNCLRSNRIETLIQLLNDKRPAVLFVWTGFDIGGGQRALSLEELFNAATRDRLFGRHLDALQKYRQIQDIDPYYQGLDREIAHTRREMDPLLQQWEPQSKPQQRDKQAVPRWMSTAVGLFVLVFLGVTIYVVWETDLLSTLVSNPTPTNTPTVTPEPIRTTEGTPLPSPSPTLVLTNPTNVATETSTIQVTPTPIRVVPPTRILPHQVLFDVSHHQDTARTVQPDIALYWHDSYSSLKVALANRGMQYTISDRSLLSHDLSEYGLIIINLAWAWEEPYTEQEGAKILQYVQQGGNLILMGDHEGTPNENLSAITTRLGIRTGGSWGIGTNESGLEHLVVFTDHPIFDGITDIILDYWGGELAIIQDRFVVATGETTDGQIAVAALRVGEGRVIILGDMAIWHDTEISSLENNGQNYQFLTNALDWMLTEPTTNN